MNNIIYNYHVFTTNANHALTQHLGEKNSSRLKRVILEIALSSLTIASNEESITPFKYYRTSYFVESVVPQAAANREAYFHDKILYHALLYTLSKTALHFTRFNDERFLTLLSSPIFIDFVATQSWFKEMKKQCLKMGVYAGISEAFAYGKHQIKQYILNQFFNPLFEVIKEDKSVLLSNLIDSSAEFIQERSELLKDLAMDVQQGIGHLIKKGGQDLTSAHQIESLIHRLKSSSEKIDHLAALPQITILKERHLKARTQIPFYLKAYTAWTLVSDYQPALAPLLFTSPSSDAVDISIRVGGVAAAYFTGHNLVSAAATEILSQSIPGNFRQFQTNQRLSETTKAVSQCLIGSLNAIKNSFRELAREDDLSLSTIRSVEKVTAQCFLASVYLAAAHHSHPLANALGACTFIEYLGIVGDHYHLMELHQTTSQTAFIDKIPYQVILGLSLTMIEMGTSLSRFTISLGSIGLGAPLMADRIVNTNFYQEHILTPMKGIVSPNYRVQRWASVTRKAASLVNSIGLGSRLTRLTQRVAALTQISILIHDGYQFFKNPDVQRNTMIAGAIAFFVGDIYMKSVFCSTVSFHLGTAVGAMANGIRKPKDIAALGAVSAGVVVGLFSQSPFQVTATTEIVDFALRTPKGRNLCNQITRKFMETVVPATRVAARTMGAGFNLAMTTFHYLKSKFI